MQSANADNFFQTEAAQEKQARRAARAGNKHGDPLVMKSKILAAIPDPASPSSGIYIAESAGSVRRINLETSTTKTSYRGPKAPVTCLAIGGPNSKTLFAGSWDKDIWTWDVETGSPGRRLSGHSDFVKAVVCTKLDGKDILISGGADKKIMVWDIASGRRMHTALDPFTTMLAVQHIAVDPHQSTADTVFFFTASSDRHIRRWSVTATAAEQLPSKFPYTPSEDRITIEEHETSVYKLVFEADDDDVNLWTASADGTAKCLCRSRDFATEDSYEHGDYVRAVAVTEDWVITAGRSEDIKVWDRNTGKLYCTLEGHFDEITDLILLPDATTGRLSKFCSVSIDGTVRTWPLAKKDLDRVVQEIEETKKPKEKEEDKAGDGMLTAEEEAELAELMDD